MTERPIIFMAEMVRAILAGRKTQTRRLVKPGRPCHYGRPGDRLWVKETYACMPAFDGVPPSEIDQFVSNGRTLVLYEADEPKVKVKWRNKLFMPRWMSRIDLEIIAVRLEYLQSISNSDARCEGIQHPGMLGEWKGFMRLWDSIHTRNNHWEDNPRVWVIEFRRL